MSDQPSFLLHFELVKETPESELVEDVPQGIIEEPKQSETTVEVAKKTEEYHDSVGFVHPDACVEYIDHMGSDARVVNATRVSFNKKIDEDQPLSDPDARLIRYLCNHKHESPFFHNQVTLRIRMPIFLVREWFRHTVGLSRNEVSRRYVKGDAHIFLPAFLRETDPKIKQGSKPTPIEESDKYLKMMEDTSNQCIQTYRTLLENGVAPEQARIILPLGLMTEFIETGSLMAYARIYKLRYSPDAQTEIRAYAVEIGKIMRKLFPVAWEALVGDIELKTPEKK